MNPELNLKGEGLELPAIESPAFNYLPLSEHNSVIYLAGQLAKIDGKLPNPGRVVIDVSREEAARQMQQCALQALARLKDHCGSLERIKSILHMNAYVACDHEFDGISQLADHASAVFITAFKDRGRHPRSVLGLVRLPQNAPVMIDLRVAIY